MSKILTIINKNLDKIFIIIVMIVFILPMPFIFYRQKSISLLENRSLEQLQVFNFAKFFNHEFQNNLESTLADQMIKAETLKQNYLYYKKGFSEKIAINFSDKIGCENRYLPIEENFFMFDCNREYLLWELVEYNNLINEIKKTVNNYNNHFINEKVKYYLYYIDESGSHDFEKNKEIGVGEYLKNNLNLDGYDYLKIDDFDTYKKYFYKTDHHWNKNGSYKGYQDIVKMLLGEKEKALKPIEDITFDIKFRGTKVRMNYMANRYDIFSVYKFDIKNHKEYQNGKSIPYGKSSQYFNNNFKGQLWTSHYAEFYGWDYGEVVFDFEDQTKENLLIIGNSFTNPINVLIASHYNKTYVVDLRHYENEFGEKFELANYIKENNIDSMIIIGNYSLFLDKFRF